ncbi:hypothetical protein [Actinomyces bovis]|uniref:hypothetical protein n=1 Tax=Actinomyces bovis TaxID=1658 RepID=UPI0014730830|nr:hypothetical protein [Actinomyces bovis]
MSTTQFIYRSKPRKQHRLSVFLIVLMTQALLLGILTALPHSPVTPPAVAAR